MFEPAYHFAIAQTPLHHCHQDACQISECSKTLNILCLQDFARSYENSSVDMILKLSHDDQISWEPVSDHRA